jgi:DNA-3-methyladenine glycosylase II
MTRNTFELTPASPYRLDLTVWTLRRRSHNIVDRWDGTTYRRVLPLPAGSVELAVTQTTSPESPRLTIQVAGQLAGDAVHTAVTAALERLLGLRIDLKEFHQLAAHDGQLGPLAHRFQGMRPPRFATAFEGAVNAIACQQLTLTLGVHLLNRLAVAFGAAFGEGDETVHAFPRPEELAGLSPSNLRALGFSRQKGQAIVELAESIATRQLDLEGLTVLPDEDALMHLRTLRGVGRWTAEYVLLRGMGRTHVFPGDDVGARKNLQRWLHLVTPLNYDGVRAILSRWDGYAGLVYFLLLLDRLAEAGDLDENRYEECGDRGATLHVKG